MAQNQFTKFKALRKELLRKRGLEYPDGRNLYQYRLNTKEFEDVESLLRHWLGIMKDVELGLIIRITGFPALFVLYAAEWWRRRYDGSGFRWEPILHDLGVDPAGWSPNQRSETVRQGLREWHLEVRKTGGLRFLGTVAVQGGLPLRLLSEARGGVGRLLHHVLRSAQNHHVSMESIQGWVESLKGQLPKSYRQDAIYALLSDMVLTALELKQKAALSPGDDAVAVLEQKIPTWKDRFPLAMEDKYARGLVEQLIQEATRVRMHKIPPRLPVVRQLERDLEGRWVLSSRIDLPELLENKALSHLFSLEKEELPRIAQLKLLVADQKFQTQLRRLAGRNSYRVEPDDWHTLGHAAMAEHLLQLLATDGRIWFGGVPGGEVLDDELPWLFSSEEDGYRFLRQGTGKVAAPQVLLALPTGWRLAHMEQSAIESAGQLYEPDRKLYWVRGAVDVEDPEGLTRKIRTGQADSRKINFHWVGDRMWLDFHNPARAHRGMPRLYRSDDEGGGTRVEGSPVCSVLSAPHSSQSLGPVTLRYPAKGGSQIRTRMVLLPEQAELKLQPADSRRGRLGFFNWGIQSVRVMDPGIDSNIQSEGNSLYLDVNAPPGTPTPQWLTLEIGWPHSTHQVGLRVPFPAKGIRAFDGQGGELSNGVHLALHELPGVRAMVSGGGHFCQLELEIGTSQQHFVRRYPLKILLGALSLELSVIDYLEDIQQLLSLDDSADALAILRFRSGGNELFRLKVARYAVLMERDQDQLLLEGRAGDHLSEEMLRTLPVLATRLEYPEDEPLSLEPVTSEGVTAAAWLFSPSQREPGTWLIYPGPDAAVQFRSCVWPVEGEIETDEPLVRAMSLKNQAARDSAIIEVIKDLATDFLHPSWIKVEQLVGQFGHLPLATLDLWRHFSHVHSGMAALAFRLGSLPKGFVVRFARELPFAWEVVSVDVWRQAMERLQSQCHHLYDDIAETIFASHLEECRKVLISESGALNYLLGIASVDFSATDAQQAQQLKQISPVLTQRLFDGDDSDLMKLRRSHAEDTWPSEFNDLVEQAREDPDIQPFLYHERFGYPDGVINLPLITAAACAQGKSGEYLNDSQAVHLLRTYRSFDIDWFDEAFNRTIAHCYAEGVIN